MPYAITTRDGITIQNIPDDVPPDSPVLKDRVASLRAQKQPDMASMQAGLTQPAGAVERFITGAGAPIVGLGQLAARPLAAAGQVLESVAGPTQVGTFLQELPARNDQVAQQFQQYRQSIAPEGADIAGTAGEIAATLPLALAGGLPATVGGLARAGAVGGALTGAAQPVTGGDFASDKAAQVGTGAAIGAVAAPALNAALKPVAMAAKRAYGALAARIRPDQSIDDIAHELTMTLNQEGIDVAALGNQYIKARAAEVAAARQVGGQIDDAALANDAAAKSLGIDLTRGQATQNPSQFSRELFLREAPGGEELATQYANTLSKLNGSLDNLARGLPAPSLKVDAGERAIASLLKIDEPRRAQVGRLYEAAKNSAGRETPVDGRNLVDKSFTQLEKDLLLSEVPGDIRTFLNTVSEGQPLTIGRAEEVVKAINGRISGLLPRDPQRVALNTIKTNLDAAIENSGSAAGDEAAAAFKKARTAAAVRFKQIEKVPLLKEALDDKITPDAFIDKLLYRSTRDDFKATRAYLRANDRSAWNGIRSQALDDLRQAATGGSDDATSFSQSAFNKALGRLQKDGRIGLLFSETELRTLKAIGKVGELVQKGPPGVSRTGLSGAAKASGMLADLLSRVSGRGGALVSAVVKRGGATAEAASAMRPASITKITASPINTRPASTVGTTLENQ